MGNPSGHPNVHGRLRPPSVRQPLQQLLQSPHGLRSYLRPQAAPEAAPGPVQQTVPRWVSGYWDGGMGARMKWSNSTRCDIYRSVRNAIKLTKWQEMLRSQPLWGHFWRILCYEAGHKWTQPTLHCTCCAVCIGRHNCRHYNWLAAASVLGCLQNHKNNTSFSFCSWKQN